jgi:hypothetical protein
LPGLDTYVYISEVKLVKPWFKPRDPGLFQDIAFESSVFFELFDLYIYMGIFYFCENGLKTLLIKDRCPICVKALKDF